MAKYLLQVSYTPSGAQGVMKEGGSSRRDMVAKLLADVGGTLDEFYFAFGEDDVIHHRRSAGPRDGGRAQHDGRWLRRRVREDDGAAHAGGDRSGGQAIGAVPGSGSVVRS